MSDLTAEDIDGFMAHAGVELLPWQRVVAHRAFGLSTEPVHASLADRLGWIREIQLNIRRRIERRQGAKRLHRVYRHRTLARRRRRR